MNPFPFEDYELPFEDWIDDFVNDWLVPNLGDFFRTISRPIDETYYFLLDNVLLAKWMPEWLPALVFLPILFIIAWVAAGWRVGFFSVAGMVLVGFMGYWEETMETLGMVLTAVVFCVVTGVPVGIIASRYDWFASIVRPFLDMMQTIPAFVYLVPIVMLFGVGAVPGIIATIIFALPPIIRLTNLGIRQVDPELVEAAYAFGSTPIQVLWNVQIPLAMRTIMAGLNQTLMLALSMVVIAALVGAPGLGAEVRVALGRLQIGHGMTAGFSIVILAIILDRISQALAEPDRPTTAKPLRGLVIMTAAIIPPRILLKHRKEEVISQEKNKQTPFK